MTNEWRDEQRRAQPFWQTHKNSFIAWVGAHVDCRSKLLYLFDGIENGFNVVFKKAYITNSQMNLAWNEKKKSICLAYTNILSQLNTQFSSIFFSCVFLPPLPCFSICVPIFTFQWRINWIELVLISLEMCFRSMHNEWKIPFMLLYVKRTQVN